MDQIEQTAISKAINTATENSNKRKICLVVSPLPKYHDNKKFAKFLKGHDITYSRAKKISGNCQAEIVFEDDDQKAMCIEKFKDLKNPDGSKINLQDKAERVEEIQNIRRRETKPRELPECIEDVVTSWHKIPYEEQLEKKTKDMTEVLRKITQQTCRDSAHDLPAWAEKQRGKICCPFEGIRGSPNLEGYRNKVEFTIGYDLKGNPIIGFLLGSFQDGVTATADPSQCKNVSKLANEVRMVFQRFIEKSERKPYTKTNHTGFWRLLTIRTTELNESMAVIQVNPADCPTDEIEQIKTELIQEVVKSGLLQSLFIQYFSGISNAAPWDCPVIKLWGSDYVHEQLLGLKFRISPSAFFQVNTKSTEVLYSIVRDWCGNLDQNANVLDICCGTGSIALCVASAGVNQVIGVEMVEGAVHDATHNAQLNSIQNCTFVAGKAEDVLSKSISLFTTKDAKIIGIVDPPRAGLHPKAIQVLRRTEAIERLVYVSCNQGALVNDAAQLCKAESRKMVGKAFIPTKAIAVDLFPHTPHSELIVLFERDCTSAPMAVDQEEVTTQVEASEGTLETVDVKMV